MDRRGKTGNTDRTGETGIVAGSGTTNSWPAGGADKTDRTSTSGSVTGISFFRNPSNFLSLPANVSKSSNGEVGAKAAKSPRSFSTSWVASGETCTAGSSTTLQYSSWRLKYWLARDELVKQQQVGWFPDTQQREKR